MSHDIESTSLTQRVVLLGLADLSTSDETPAHAPTVLRTCSEAVDDVDGDVVGRLTESDGARALNELETTGLVESISDAESPTGKGRPRYRLAVDRTFLLDALGEDDRLVPVVDRIGGR
jgi:hypothetical protein